jgi:hypothetical protein
MSILEKGDKVLNPKTKRYVSVGSTSWKKLVLEGVLEGSYKPSATPLKKTMVEKKLVKKVKKVEEDEDDEEDEEEDIELLEQQLSEILKKNDKPKVKTAGRPKKPKFVSKVIDSNESDDDDDE